MTSSGTAQVVPFSRKSPGSKNGRRASMAATASDHRSVLRALADTYERVQKIRLECGERIRAVAQGRTKGSDTPVASAAALLAKIRTGHTDGPIPALGQTYRLHITEERRLRKAMERSLAGHAAWDWLERVRGVGPTLGAKLLGRLDIQRAPTPSCFWSYCGLATVPGRSYGCGVCGARKTFPHKYRATGRHRSRHDKSDWCDGRFEPMPADEKSRVAPPRPGPGEKPAFDPTARKICYLLGTSFLRVGGPYAEFYRLQRVELELSERRWTDGHFHMAALRKMEKLFLADLWSAWADATGLTTRAHYSSARLHRNGTISEREMVERQPVRNRHAPAVESEKPE